MAVTKTHPIKSTLKAAIDYICNPDKTDGKLLVSSFGCTAETADIEFVWTRRHSIDSSPAPASGPVLPVRALGVGGIDWTGFDPSVLDRSFFNFSLLDLLVFNCAGFSRSVFFGFGSGGLGCSRMVYSMAPSWPLGLRPCIAARPPMRKRIWAASFAPPTGEK